MTPYSGFRPRRPSRRWCDVFFQAVTCVSIALGAAALEGCRSDGAADAGAAKTQPEGKRPRGEVTPPAGLDASEVAPLQGDALARAKMPLAEVVASAPRPEFLPAPDAPIAEPKPRPEPPLAAQQAYLAGRMAWREGKSWDAVRQLQQALRLAPSEPDVLRLLGDIYTSIGNKVRGAQYVREAVAADPANVDGVIQLGRFALEEGRWPEAIATLAAADTRLAASGQDPALRRLVSYYLAGALMQEGYAQAAISEYERYLGGLGQIGGHATPQARELAILDQQAALTWQSVGDLHHRLGDPKAALAAYETASKNAENDRIALVRRLLYTQLKLGQESAAQQLVLEQLGRTEADATTLQLVRYLTEQGAGTDAFAERLRELYERDGRSPTMAIAIADLLPPAQATALLTSHLAERPQDRLVYDRLLSRHLLPQGAGTAGPEAVRRAVDVTADVMDRSQHADELAMALIAQAQGPTEIIAAVQPIPVGQRPSVDVIRSLALVGAGDIDAAESVLEKSVEVAPQAQATRLQLAKLLIARDRFARAQEVLEPLGESRDAAVVAARVRVLTETGQPEQALRLLDQMIGAGSTDVSLILQKASLQLRAGDAVGAERTLLDALNMNPRDEQVYEALLSLYDPSSPGQAQVPDAMRQWQRLVKRLLTTIPQSRIGRLVRAELHDAKGEFTDAEQLLKGLLEENQKDTRALRDLLEIYVRANRRQDALSILDAQLAANPKDPQMLLIAGGFYKQLNEFDKTLDVVERWLLQRAPTPERDAQLASLYLDRGDATKALEAAERAVSADDAEDPVKAMSLLGRALLELGRGDEADRRFAQAIERFPQHAADLGYERGALWHHGNDRARTERLMLQNLERFPEHAPTNNDIGYNWVVQNKDLERAKSMIQRAADAEPESSAYLDSLGWAHYKLGQFAEAETWLRRARQAQGGYNPVIVDHLGDALYRQGKRAEAIQAWQEAKGLLETGLPTVMEQSGNALFQQGRVAEAVHLWLQVKKARNGEQPWDDPEMKGLGDRLTAKIDAARGDDGVLVTPLPGEPEGPVKVARPGAGADADGGGEPGPEAVVQPVPAEGGIAP